jgi:hypothetical protein
MRCAPCTPLRPACARPSRLFKKVHGVDEAWRCMSEQPSGRAPLCERAAALFAAAALAIVSAPQVVRVVRDARAQATADQLRVLGDEFARQHGAAGAWPCHWRERTSQVKLDGLACRVAAVPGPRDAWGHGIIAVYERPTLRIAAARDGTIALISAGPDGRVTTSRRRAIEGEATGDDLVHVVTREAG